MSLAAEEDAGDWVRRAQIESGRMSWTLGPVADLFWMLVEEARPLLVDLVHEEVTYAADHGGFLAPISEMSLAGRVFFDLVVPDLRSGALPGGVAFRCLAIWELVLRESKDRLWLDVILSEVLEPLSRSGLQEKAEALHPRLWITVDECDRRLNP
ncbi:hypothetical protein UO65_2936 [Actinokineospora spheciospongiae]|uniref:Uncharacterized protein n=1 Tax=Actinokineospora spheciospongiae TaxID=909613 RepID=W7J6S1_9PSEU|nr:hypothetical protein UO65_2936 [Actinokineospora spheciospongiae]